MIQAATSGAMAFARLVGDDRVHVEPASGRLLVRPAPALAGLIEIRGLGIRRLPFEPVAAVGLVVDLDAAAERLPTRSALETIIEGVRLPRLAIRPETRAFPVVLAALGYPRTAPGPGGI
jgi:serine kinase of HPr protein (carbohydrate metabolism regulator)